MDINLLPRESTPNKSQQKVFGAINKVAVVVSGLFLIMVLAGAAIYFLLANRLESVKKESEKLQTNVANLQSTESSLVLLKNRMQNIQAILGSRINEDYLEKQNKILDFASENVVFVSNEIDSGRSSIELKLASSTDLVSLLSNLMASSDFSSLVINELTFNPTNGYSLVLEVF